MEKAQKQMKHERAGAGRHVSRRKHEQNEGNHNGSGAKRGDSRRNEHIYK